MMVRMLPYDAFACDEFVFTQSAMVLAQSIYSIRPFVSLSHCMLSVLYVSRRWTVDYRYWRTITVDRVMVEELPKWDFGLRCSYANRREVEWFVLCW